MEFKLLARDSSTRARLGKIVTDHGEIHTPVFMPVGTAGTVKAITQEQLEELGAEVILGNTYHLYLRPGHELIGRSGGPAPLHVLEAAAPDRQRRVPGLQPKPPAHH